MKYLIFLWPVLASFITFESGCAVKPNLVSPKTSAEALNRLKSGNQRFANHHAIHPGQSAERIATTAKEQKPYAAIITCSDSRVPPEIIFDEGIGDLFVIRNAGNFTDLDDVLASVEYAVVHLDVHLILVLGHENCGAIKAMTAGVTHDEPEHIQTLVKHLESEPEEQKALSCGLQGNQLVHVCVLANIEHGLLRLKEDLDKIHNHEGHPLEVEVVGGVYDLATGVVYFE